jgi:hypothetical protein
MRIFRGVAAGSLMVILASTAPAKADEAPPGALAATRLPIPADSSKAFPDDVAGTHFSKAAFDTATPAVRVALCGVEAAAGNTGLDAGLIDFNVPDTARGAGRTPDDMQDVGKNLRDFHSSVFLGVTLGYHF